MLSALTNGQVFYALAMLVAVASFAATVTSRRVGRMVRRWAYSPRRSYGMTRVTRTRVLSDRDSARLWGGTRVISRDEALTDAMRRHPAGSRR